MIYTHLSEFIFSRLLLPNGIEEKNKAIYMYGLEVVVSSLMNLLILIVISLILGITTEMFFFFLAFVPLRLYGHGTHASSHSRCLTLFTVTMLASIYIGRLLASTTFYTPFILLGLICCLVLQFRFSTDRRGNLRYKNQLLIGFLFPWMICLLTGIALFTSIEPKYTIISALGIYIHSLSLTIKKES